MPVELDYGPKRILTDTPWSVKSGRWRPRSCGPQVNNPEGWVRELYLSYPNCCYCDVQLTRENRSLDHYVPRSKGGLRTPENMRTCCVHCNRVKGNRSPEDWLAWLEQNGKVRRPVEALWKWKFF